MLRLVRRAITQAGTASVAIRFHSWGVAITNLAIRVIRCARDAEDGIGFTVTKKSALVK